jgi:putative hydrolase of the HAD superfamily
MIEHDGDEFTAVLFDAGGVLVLPDPTVLGPLLAPYGGAVGIEAHHRAHYAGMAAKSADGSPEHDWVVYDRAYVVAIGVGDVDLDEAAEVLGRTRHAHIWRWPIPDALSVLPGLRDRSDALGVVSNAAGQIESVLARVGVCQVGAGSGTAVRCVIDSHVVGVAKPDPQIFDHALEHFDGVDRSRILYVGDSVTMDVGGARAAGLEPVLIDPYDDHAGADFRRIRSLLDLLGP